jgi:predicted ATPase
MVEFVATLIGALAAGAIAKASDIGGRAVADAYDTLRALILRKLSKGGAVQMLEDEPRSETAQAVLAEALTKAGLVPDPELAQQAETLRAALGAGAGTAGADIDVGNIVAGVNVVAGEVRMGSADGAKPPWHSPAV